jgi:trehalose-phosphatase
MRQIGPRNVLQTSDRKICDFLRSASVAGARVLMLDYDGTLAPFCIDSQRAVPYVRIPDLLRRLTEETDTRVIIVSGRCAQSTERLLGMPGLEIWGCHGLERLRTNGTLEMPELPRTRCGS